MAITGETKFETVGDEVTPAVDFRLPPQHRPEPIEIFNASKTERLDVHIDGQIVVLLPGETLLLPEEPWSGR